MNRPAGSFLPLPPALWTCAKGSQQTWADSSGLKPHTIRCSSWQPECAF